MTTTNTLIGEAMAILSGPDDEARETAITAWVESERDKITALYYARKAALSRASLFAEQAERMTLLMRREQALATYCDSRARDLLETERAVAGFAEGEPYKVALASGIKPALVLNQAAVLIVDRDKIPADLWRHPAPPAPEPDKVAIKERLMAQQAVPGCELTRGQRFDWGEPKKRGD